MYKLILSFLTVVLFNSAVSAGGRFEWEMAPWGTPRAEVVKAMVKAKMNVEKMDENKLISISDTKLMVVCTFDEHSKLAIVHLIQFTDHWVGLYQGLLRSAFSRDGWDVDHKYTEALTVSTDPQVEKPTYFLSKHVSTLTFLKWAGDDGSRKDLLVCWDEENQTFLVGVMLVAPGCDEKAPVDPKGNL